MTASLIDFNPDPRIERMPIVDGQWCYVIDDALLDPDRLVKFAAAQRGEFHVVDYNAYPGLLLHSGDIREPNKMIPRSEWGPAHSQRLFHRRHVK